MSTSKARGGGKKGPPEAPASEPSPALSAAEEITEQHFIYHINTTTRQIVKVEELDPKSGARKEVPMSDYAYGYDPYGATYDPYSGYYDPYSDPYSSYAAYGEAYDPYTGYYAYDPYDPYGWQGSYGGA